MQLNLPTQTNWTENIKDNYFKLSILLLKLANKRVILTNVVLRYLTVFDYMSKNVPKQMYFFHSIRDMFIFIFQIRFNLIN